jgi:hypothetical protein
MERVTTLRRRPVLVLAWTFVVVAWCVAAVVAVGLTSLLPCGGDGGSPYAAPASPAGEYCRAVEGYFESGEPGELTTALVYLSPVALLVAFGALGVWFRSVRVLIAIGTLAFLALALHVALAFSLPNRCSPDDESISSCQHY